MSEFLVSRALFFFYVFFFLNKIIVYKNRDELTKKNLINTYSSLIFKSMKTLYPTLGIDESTNKDSEVFVGVCSYQTADLVTSQEPLVKSRSVNFGIDSFLEEHTQFKYVQINSQFCRENELSNWKTKLISIATLIRNFYEEENKEIGNVIIDGEFDQLMTQELYGMIFPYSPNITPIPRADSTIPLVNMADNIAYRLTSHRFKKNKNFRDIYSNNRIEPNLEDTINYSKKCLELTENENFFPMNPVFIEKVRDKLIFE